MAFLTSITPIALYFTVLIIGCQHKEAFANGLLDVLSGLYKKSVNNKQPVVVVLTKDLLQSEVKALPKAQLKDSSEDDLYNILHLTLDKHQLKKARPQSKSLLPYKLKTEKKYHASRDDLPYHNLGLRANKDILRSPIVKSLLRISNSLRCEAQDDCKDICSNKFSGSKKIKCTVKCQVEFDCNEEKEEDYVDPCQDDQCKDSCAGSNECGMSTKGVTLVTEKPGCTRC